MTWDEYYLNICKTVAKNSKCLSRNIGAILVKDKSIISTGYNGPPRGVQTCKERILTDRVLEKKFSNPTKAYRSNKCPRQILGYKSGEGLEWCVAGHAERNALINAARNGICTKDSIIYMDCPVPCGDCLIEIINAGVKEVVCTNFKFYDYKGEYLYNNSDIRIRTYE